MTVQSQSGEACSSPEPDPSPELFAVSSHTPSFVFIYRDEHEQPLAAVARFEAGTLDAKKKTFLQHRFEDGHWLSGLKGLHLPLYRLAEVLRVLREGGVLFIVEGEKCVEALRRLGLIATTNPGGAGKWNSAYTQLLRGGKLVVLADHDERGRRHVQALARELHGEVTSLRVMDSPVRDGVAPTENWDVADWIEAGGTAEELKVLTAACPEWTPSEAANNQEWDEPIPFATSTQAAPFDPAQMLTPFLAELAREIAKSVKVDVAAPAVLLPAVISAGAGNAFAVQVSPGYVEPNLARYTFWSKPSGERGSETFRRATRPLEEWTHSQTPAYDEEKRQYDADALFLRKKAEKCEAKAATTTKPGESERLRREAREARLSMPKPPARPLLYMGDCTSEAFCRLMYEQGGAMALFSADARHAADEILGRYSSEGKTNDSLYLRAHGGDCIDRGRIGADGHGEMFRIAHPSLAIALCLQPDKLAQLASRPELAASGFLGRCNIVEPRSLVGTRLETGDERPMDKAVVAAWNSVVAEIVRERRKLIGSASDPDWQPAMIVLSDEAMVARRNFANEIEVRQLPGGDLHALNSFASKAGGEAARLAGLLHLAELALDNRLSEAAKVPVPIEIWAIAERHQRWQLAESLRVLSLAQEDVLCGKARRLLAWCATRPDAAKCLATREVIGARFAGSAAEAEDLLHWLVDRGWARQLPSPGRTPRWEVNPRVHEAPKRSGGTSADSAAQQGGAR